MQKSMLRLPGYIEEYVEQEINDLCQVTDCQHSTAPIVATKTNYRMIRTSNVRHACLIIETMDYVTEDTYHKWSVRGYLEKADVILTREAPMGEVAIIKSDEYKFFLGQRVLQLKSNTEKVIPGYLHLLFQSNRFETYIRPLRSSGSTVSNIRIPDLKQMKFYIPSLNEQQKVTSFFSLLDWKIKKQQEKIIKLEELKKGMMQKIFSRKIQFKDKNGGEFSIWKKKKLGQVLKIRHGKDQKKIEAVTGKYPILGTGGEIGRTDTPIYEKESVLIGRKGTIDRPVYMNSPFWTVDTLFYSEINEDFDPKFIYFLFQTINWKKYNEASGVPSLNARTIESIIAYFPIKEEQRKISAYLSTVDEKIDKEQEKSNQLLEEKKGFMQRMFV